MLAALVVGLACVARLSTMAEGLWFVDFIHFSARAERLADGQDLLSGLYPVGYPTALLLLKGIIGDVLWAGRAISIFAAAVGIWTVGRWLGPAAGLWLAAQAAFLTYGRLEGTDLLAATLSLGAIAAAWRRGPAAAGALLGAALMTRYTALSAVPVVGLTVALRCPRRQWLRFGVAVAAVTSPHWLSALWLGRSPLPDQRFNLAIAHGGPVTMMDAAPWLAWPRNFLHVGHMAIDSWPITIGTVGLVVGILGRDKRAALLALFAITHVALVAFGFAKPRLVLPTTLALSLGAAWLLPRWWLALPAAPVLAWHVWQVSEIAHPEKRLSEICAASAALAPPFMSSHPWFHVRSDGWVHGATPLREIGPPPNQIRPADLLRYARATGHRHIALDSGRLRATYPLLRPILKDPDPPGLRVVAKAKGWRVYEVLRDTETPTSSAAPPPLPSTGPDSR